VRSLAPGPTKARNILHSSREGVECELAGYRVKGFLAVADRALYWDTICKSAEQRFKVLRFWERHGLLATQEAFGVSRRTLFAWRAQLRRGKGKPHTLAPQSIRPKRLRRRDWPQPLIEEIRRLRAEHPNLGKETSRRWLKQAERDTKRSDGGLMTTEREELSRLRRENRQPKLQREILSKAAAWFANATRHRSALRVRDDQPGRGGRPRVGFIHGRSDRSTGVSARIAHSGRHSRHPGAFARGVYGSPNIHAELAEIKHQQT
jgi:transposase-like protein